MPRKPDERIDQAKEMYLQGKKLVEIASKLNLPEGTIRSWKNRYKWDCNVANKKRNVANRKRGGQPGNHNATGPPGNKNAEKHGLFTKYLPAETMDIVNSMSLNPLDILWDQIQVAYAAIIRAQKLMYVRDKQAWDKQEAFLKAQARAQSELRSLIKQYDEMLHKDWEMTSEEQRIRIDVMRAKAQLTEDAAIADDGFLEALKGSAAEDWSDEED